VVLKILAACQWLYQRDGKVSCPLILHKISSFKFSSVQNSHFFVLHRELCGYFSAVSFFIMYLNLSDLYRVRQKNLTVFKFRYIGNRVGWNNATKVSG